MIVNQVVQGAERPQTVLGKINPFHMPTTVFYSDGISAQSAEVGFSEVEITVQKNSLIAFSEGTSLAELDGGIEFFKNINGVPIYFISADFSATS